MLQMSKRDFKDKQTSREKKKHVRIHFILNEYLAFIKFCFFWLTLRRMIYLLGKPNTIKKIQWASSGDQHFLMQHSSGGM